jgi:hypothetical protein
MWEDRQENIFSRTVVMRSEAVCHFGDGLSTSMITEDCLGVPYRAGGLDANPAG